MSWSATLITGVPIGAGTVGLVVLGSDDNPPEELVDPEKNGQVFSGRWKRISTDRDQRIATYEQVE